MFTWTDEQTALRDGLSRWHQAFGADHLEWDRRAEFPAEKWQSVRESGILTIPFKEQWGGLGQDLPTMMMLFEDLGYGCRDSGLSFSISTHMISTGIPVQRFGSDALKSRILPVICDGSKIGAHAISEPDSGSDAFAMRTTATLSEDKASYHLNGSKTFVSNGPVADLIVVYAKTAPKFGAMGVSAFIVEKGTPGLTVGKPISKMGLKTSPLCELYFDDCVVPAENLIGKPGLGFSIVDHVMKWEILCSFAITLGEMKHRMERCLDYAKTRHQFGKPIGSFQSVANKIVDMRLHYESARALLYGAAQRVVANENATIEIALAKLAVSEANLSSALEAVRIFGGNGYMTEYGLECDLRNAVPGTIYSGTSEVQRDRIAKMMGL